MDGSFIRDMIRFILVIRDVSGKTANWKLKKLNVLSASLDLQSAEKWKFRGDNVLHLSYVKPKTCRMS